MRNKNLKIIYCYSIYGENYDKYYMPLLLSIDLLKKNNFRIAICTTHDEEKRISKYFSDSISDNIVKMLTFNEEWHQNNKKILRYLVPRLIEGDIYCYRDSDSLVDTREIYFLKSWIQRYDNSQCLIFRDHPLHVALILAGMFNCKHEAAIKISELCESEFSESRMHLKNPYNYDQKWLANCIYDKFRSSTIVMSSYFYYTGEKIIPILPSESPANFIGAQYSESLNKERQKEYFKYSKYYKGSLLKIPYHKFFRNLYGFVRPSIILAIIFKFLINKKQ